MPSFVVGLVVGGASSWLRQYPLICREGSQLLLDSIFEATKLEENDLLDLHMLLYSTLGGSCTWDGRWELGGR